MQTSRDIDALITSYLYNPFREDATKESENDLFARFDGGAAVARLIREGQVDRAGDLLLAIGHAQACRNPESHLVLGEDVLPQASERALPRPRADYRRIALAAGRASSQLRRVQGSSSQMNRARRDTWAACFGDSLRHALELERVIRDHDVLVFGETGTGKEMFAHAIQLATPGGKDGEPAPRAAINAAAVPDTLVESELFGHVKGAFTGAADGRVGRLRSAHGGSFFLDEVGDLPATTQVKFLRVIETNEIFPVGSDTPHSVDVRYIAATHKNLEALVEAREFRRDLYERLAGNVLRIPPLRERTDDIVEIGRAFVLESLERTHSGHEIPPAIEKWLVSREARDHRWPGNVRELQNALRNLLLGLSPGIRTPAQSNSEPATHDVLPTAIHNGTASMQEVSDWYMERVLQKTSGNYTQTARTLGIDRSTVRRRMRAQTSKK